MSLLTDNPDGATPLSPDDLIGLKLPHIQSNSQLNEIEAANILQGQAWVASHNTLTRDEIFSREFVVALHESLLGDIWTWAGTFRQREVNIGVDPVNISVDLHNFLEDAKCWVEFNHFTPLMLNARIQHRLVQIHCFANGNGRHSRIFADTVTIFLLKKKPLKWANVELEYVLNERNAYIGALRKADAGDFTHLESYLLNIGN